MKIRIKTKYNQYRFFINKVNAGNNAKMTHKTNKIIPILKTYILYYIIVIFKIVIFKISLTKSKSK